MEIYYESLKKSKFKTKRKESMNEYLKKIEDYVFKSKKVEIKSNEILKGLFDHSYFDVIRSTYLLKFISKSKISEIVLQLKDKILSEILEPKIQKNQICNRIEIDDRVNKLYCYVNYRNSFNKASFKFDLSFIKQSLS